MERNNKSDFDISCSSERFLSNRLDKCTFRTLLNSIEPDQVIPFSSSFPKCLVFFSKILNFFLLRVYCLIMTLILIGSKTAIIGLVGSTSLYAGEDIFSSTSLSPSLSLLVFSVDDLFSPHFLNKKSFILLYISRVRSSI